MGMTIMFFLMINSGLQETVLSFVSFFFPPWTQVRDKLLTLESFAAAETGLLVGSAQQFLSQNQRLG